MGLFTKEPKAEGGYYLQYDGNYVMRQNAKAEWIRFETQDANFNPDDFVVMDNDEDRNTVRAKFLMYKGNYLLGPDGNPYIVPYSFHFEDFITKYQSIAIPSNIEGYVEYTSSVLLISFRPGGLDDLQRSYNGTYSYSNPPFMSFTAAASFVYGVASKIMGIDIDTCLWAGGQVNKVQNIKPGTHNDTSGEMDNNPNNPPNIRRGYDFVDTLQNNGEVSATPKLSITTFSAKWQYNFQTSLGATNLAFIDAELSDQDFKSNYTLEDNPNGIVWRVNSAGIPHPDDLDSYFEQQRIIESATNQTITELQDSSDLPMDGGQSSN